MGDEVLGADPLFITDPVTGEQREVKPIGSIGWTEIQPASDSSVKELADALQKSADAITEFSVIIAKLNIQKLRLLLGIKPRIFGRRISPKVTLKRNRTRKKQRLTRLQRRQRRQKI